MSASYAVIVSGPNPDDRLSKPAVWAYLKMNLNSLILTLEQINLDSGLFHHHTDLLMQCASESSMAGKSPYSNTLN